MNLGDYLNILTKIQENHEPVVVVSLVAIQGSAPQNLGAKMLVTNRGRIWGTVGGGKVEKAAIEKAMSHIKDMSGSVCEIVEWNLQRDIGMTCGGLVRILFEVFDPRLDWNIAVFGAGHVAQELVTALLRLDCQVTCIDSRSEWLDRLPTHQRLKKICTVDMASQIECLTDKTYVVIMTMGHGTDLPILIKALQRPFPYVGNMGSAQKALVLKRDLRENGMSDEACARLKCPIGLDLGGNSPPEIAISVVAQLLSVRDKSMRQ